MLTHEPESSAFVPLQNSRDEHKQPASAVRGEDDRLSGVSGVNLHNRKL